MTTGTDAIDFQHKRDRSSDAAVALLDQLYLDGLNPRRIAKTMRKLKAVLDLPSGEWRRVRSGLLIVLGYRLLVERQRGNRPQLIQTTMPDHILREVLDALPIPSGEDGITYHAIKVQQRSRLDGWIRRTYLSEARARYRGVVGYDLHARYAYNSGQPQEWDARFVTPHANFHWDQACNSFPCVVYLSEVSPNDGPFSVMVDSLGYSPNPYLAEYDRYLEDREGADAHVAGDMVGRYLDAVPPGGIQVFTGPPGTAVMFEGRSVVHHGGFPGAGGHRLVVFINARNLWMGLLDRALRN